MLQIMLSHRGSAVFLKQMDFQFIVCFTSLVSRVLKLLILAFFFFFASILIIFFWEKCFIQVLTLPFRKPIYSFVLFPCFLHTIGRKWWLTTIFRKGNKITGFVFCITPICATFCFCQKENNMIDHLYLQKMTSNFKLFMK